MVSIPFFLQLGAGNHYSNWKNNITQTMMTKIHDFVITNKTVAYISLLHEYGSVRRTVYTHAAA